MKPSDIKIVKELHQERILPARPMILVGLGTCGIGNGAAAVFQQLRKQLTETGVNCLLKQTGCFGFCAREPVVMLYQPGRSMLVYSKVNEKDVPSLVDSIGKGVFYGDKLLCRIDEWDFHTSKMTFGRGYEDMLHWDELPFFKGQQKVVLRHAGLIDPEEMLDYIAVGGYNAFVKVLTSYEPDDVIREVKESNLRGRGGAGFPTGIKWAIMQKEVSDEKYIICNADEGDPGAYMNRNEIESDPHMIIEGMLIGAYAMGAGKGIAYVRAEYPLAVKRLRKAIAQAEEMGLLGSNILETGFSFTIDIVEGAGAFVCGEETALIASIEGKAGRPLPRPPYPASRGLYGKPTNINNVETWCNIPLIIEKGSAWFRSIGTEKSPGTKVFSLVGKVKNTGLVELPLGSKLEQFVFSIGEGTGTSRRVKAVQTGGPSGGCIPLEYFSTPVDYESLKSIGAIMGSGGMVVMDQDNCMVDVARYFLEFNAGESCGKCTPCREGSAQALTILSRITKGEGVPGDMALLQLLGRVMKDASLCALGQTSPNPITTTLNYFSHEYEEHIKEKRCHAGTCESLFMALCENSCPLHMNIPGYIELIKEERWEDAFELTLRDNPLPGTIGRICHFHCQMRCRREMLDQPVSQGEIHRYLADTMYQLGKENEVYLKLVKEKLPSTGKRVAIVGAGPAGLTAAFYLARLGHEVILYDAFSEAGGVLRYGIPQYRLPKELLKKEIKVLEMLGVECRMNRRLGDNLSLAVLKKEFDTIYMAIGAWKEVSLHIPGEEAEGVFAGTEILKEIAQDQTPSPGRRVVIVGAGNVAVDAARSLLRLGREVTVVYRRGKEDMPANAIEIAESEEEKIKYRFLSAPAEIVTGDSGQVQALRIEKMMPGDIDHSGRNRPEATGLFEDIPCDAVILAIGERVDSNHLAECLTLEKDGRIVADAMTFRTSDPQIYAGGDAVSGPSTAAEAMGTAKKAASAIDRALMKEDRFHLLSREFDYGTVVPVRPEPAGKNVGRRLSVRDRVNNFNEISFGFTGEQARDEVQRCLRCDVKC